MALSGRLFIKINNNQMENSVDVRGCDWDETRGGAERVGMMVAHRLGR